MIILLGWIRITVLAVSYYLKLRLCLGRTINASLMRARILSMLLPLSSLWARGSRRVMKRSFTTVSSVSFDSCSNIDITI